MDSILFWNAVALEANRVSHSDPNKREQTGPTLSSRALAIVHLAMYDAYAAVRNLPPQFPRYLPNTVSPPNPPPGANAQEAVAGAAFQTLSKLFPAQIDSFNPPAKFFNQGSPSFNFGLKVGDKLLELRVDDPGAGDCGYKFSLERFRHRVDPDNPMQGFHGPFYGRAIGFAISVRHQLDDPPRGDAVYRKALRQVRAKGIKPELMATLPDIITSPGPTFTPFPNRRTAEETLVGIYWGYDGANRLGTPPRFYNQIVREVAMAQGNDEGKNARLFAFVNAAMGDAGILAWEQKFCHDLWRPVVGLREHDTSFGPAAEDTDAAQDISDDADPGWLPLGAPNTNSMMKNFSPNFPAYPSGHASFGAAAFHITRLFYGQGVGTNGKPFNSSGTIIPDTLLDKLGIVSDEYSGMNQDNGGTVRPRHVRKFKNGLADMIIENGMSRIFLGVHWSFDAFALRPNNKPDLSQEKIGGVPLGLNIAADIFAAGGNLAPKFSTTGPKAQKCIGDKDKQTKEAQRDFRLGISER